MLCWEKLEEVELLDRTRTVGRGKQAQDINLMPLGFDIETTNDDNTQTAYMYIWQMSVGEYDFFGRTWDDYFCAMAILRKRLSGTLIIGIHNMSFEMAYLLPRLYNSGYLERVFARAKREPLEVVTTNGIVYRDTMALSGMSLSALAKAYCNTRKLVGDLDYSIPRNSSTPLSEQELAYCANDVRILSEYMQYLHDIYTRSGQKIPLTSTGVVRRKIRQQLRGPQYRAAINKISKMYPSTLAQYNYTMQYLFRGGYCHAQTAICGKIMENVQSDDLKSAYPAEMCHRLYPMSPFAACAPADALPLIGKGMAVIMMCRFCDITATTPHVVESKHKCIQYVGGEFENGRLYHAEELTVLLTDVDYKIYTQFYKWKKLEIISAKSARKGRLPDYLIRPLLDVYQKKEVIGAKLKATPDDGDLRQQYQAAKAQLNSYYGMCVARLNLVDIDYIGKWIETDGNTYDQEKSKSLLSPYWGIYITAYTRQTILSSIYALGADAYYSDTDSVKHKGDRAYFDNYNESIRKINREMCDYYGIDFHIFEKLGTFEREHDYDKYKTLGAKRYATIIDGIASCTVAGLPKSTFSEYAVRVGAEQALLDFEPNMRFTISGKNAHKYNGETTACICGENMHEYGSCYIYSVSFNMSVDASFLQAISIRGANQ